MKRQLSYFGGSLILLFLFNGRAPVAPTGKTQNSIAVVLPPTAQEKMATSAAGGSGVIYKADLAGGCIGSSADRPVDDPYDNVFHIQLPASPAADEVAWLQYDLFGVSDHTGVARSINDEQAIGARYVRISKAWTLQKEMIPVRLLHAGDNIVRFSLPADARYYYEVKQVRICIRKRDSLFSAIVVSQPEQAYYGDHAYLKGMLLLSSGEEEKNTRLYCNGKPVQVVNGEFETTLDLPAGQTGPYRARLYAQLPAGKTISRTVLFSQPEHADAYYSALPKNIREEGRYFRNVGAAVSLNRPGIAAEIRIPAAALPGPNTISITALRDIDLPVLQADMVNVTRGTAGFRFLPHGSRFSIPAQLTLPYDSSLIPDGYTSSDIRTYYFDEPSRRWIALPLDTIIASRQVVASLTSHFTDMINAIIKVPESPQTQGYTPTTIKDIKAADPASGITFINPPSAGNMGNASLRYDIQLPAGRQGMQPSLGLQYSNEGGNGWLGLGWNLSVPAIDIDVRWGSPRYDPQLETETYTLTGEQLSPQANRGALLQRTGEKQFHRRIEGSFDKIVRHGNSPANYWWEVTNKNGVRHFYGGTPESGVVSAAVLKDDKGNIGHWALVKSVDLNNNVVHYVYETVNDAGIAGGSVQGQQLYISQILYTGSGSSDGPYKVVFTRDRQLGEPRRKDVDISGRLGFKMVGADLLRKISVSFNGQPIRSYELTYTQGVFFKTLLNHISAMDASGKVYYSHGFSYYDDVDINGSYRPVAAGENWTIPDDNIKGDLINPIPGFTGEGSALSTTKSNNTNGGLAVTVGSLLGGAWSKIGSVGGSYGYGQDNQEGLVSLSDINGDGLPDKIFKRNGQLFYRANQGLGSRRFGDARPINGISNFSAGSTRNTSSGVQIIPFIGFFGYNHSNATSTTTDFFSDFNGDGLMDLASGGRVYFNHLNASGDPEFTTSSTPTPSPIFTGSSVDRAFLAPDPNLEAEQEQQFPLQDVVRMWQAPFDGTISISGAVQLQDIQGQSGTTDAKKDGVRVSIQSGSSVLWSTPISPNDHSFKTPSGVGNISVQKGQRIYFRLQSIYNGVDDIVNWDPVIDDQTIPIRPTDANHRQTGHYQASADFVLHSKSSVGMGKDGNIVINGSFTKAVTSDTVALVIKRIRGTDTLVLTRTYPAGMSFSGNLNIPLQVNARDQLLLSVHTDSYIDRSAVQWLPHYQYTSFPDNTPVTSGDGSPTVQGNIVPDNSNFNDWIVAAPICNFNRRDTVRVRPLLKGSAAASGMVTFTIKGMDSMLLKRSVSVSGGIVAGSDIDTLIHNVGESLFLEFACADRNLATNLGRPQVVFERDSIYTDPFGARATVVLSDTVNANLFTEPAVDYFGSLFRGWGQFGFKGIRGDNSPLDESRLNQNELNSYSQQDPSKYTDTSTFRTIQDPSHTDFITLYANGSRQSWQGYDSSVYVQAGVMSASRLWMHDVSVDSLMNGESLGTANKISSTKTNSYSAGISFGVSASYGSSEANTTTLLDVMDMNGDRYPDIINETNVQYSLPNGGLEATRRAQNTGSTASTAKSTGFTLGGAFPTAHTGKSTKDNTTAIEEVATNTIGVPGSLTANDNDDETLSGWMDINSDGLPDRIYKNGNVALNLGYQFTPQENWGIADIDRNNSKATSAGLGINIDQGSFEAGFGLSRSVGNNSTTISDVNGDGLPDKLTLSNGQLSVRLNTGNGFADAVLWQNFNALSSNVSTGESVNAAFTIVIPIPIPFFPIKICINPSFNTGHGVSRRQDQIMDVDGDGFPDLLHSNNDGDLTAYRSNIGRTNMLKTVQRPFGSYFTLDYQRTGNTYSMPQSKWVMSALEVFDGVKGDGVDTVRSTFTYSGGYYERHEREFYGFKTVTTRQLNTASGNSIYRSQVQNHLNNSYYTKGLLSGEWLEDAAGNKYTQTNYLYDVRRIADSMAYPALVRTEKLFYEGQPAAGASTIMEFDYDAYGNITKINDGGDGTQQDLLQAVVTYHNNDAIYLKSSPSSITVTTADGEKRKRSSVIDAHDNVTNIRQYLADGSSASYDMSYDEYGNISNITRPANYKGDRMWYSYLYDDAVHSYVTKVTDAFGYMSSSVYDYRFGVLTGSTSITNESIRYTLDDVGRLATVTGPYELAAGKPYTIRFTYHQEAAVPYAVTDHYDPEYDGNISTISYADGLGRPIQVKKQVSLFKAKDLADNLAMTVSGRQLYDAMGRVTKNYYPTIEAMGNPALSDGTGKLLSTSSYDVMDRPVRIVLADGAVTQTAYSITGGQFSTLTTDALGNKREVLSDVRNRQRSVKSHSGPAGVITTSFYYDALSQLLKAVDNDGNAIVTTYDNLGRRLSVQHPDAGLTTFTYDLAGNLTEKTTAQIRHDIPKGGAIKYQYEYERLTDVDYPVQYQNKVKYTYGGVGDGDRTGRLILQEDASGGQELYYGRLGEVTKTIRTILVNAVYTNTYVSEQQYDTWNRIKKMIYPDGETVTYHYNRGGTLFSIDGAKQGNNYHYVDQLGYDEYEQRVYLRYGNGTETFYSYDSLRRRLAHMRAFAVAGRPMMNNSYTYDAVSNILGISNDVVADTGKLGGASQQQYTYDNLYRLIAAKGKYKGSSLTRGYSLSMTYDNLYNIVSKSMLDSLPAASYHLSYTYSKMAPHQVAQIDGSLYKYDLNGNIMLAGNAESFWDEENRLMGVINKGVLSEYTYDAGGERVIKSSGGVQGIWVNGAPAGQVQHTDNYISYVSPYLVCRKDNFTKHFYIESQRVVTKLGHGQFANISFPQSGLTAGGIDYTRRAAQLQRDRTNYYTTLGVSPGPPTMKDFFAQPQNSGIAPPVLVDSTSPRTPPGWPSNTTPPPAGPPIFVNPVPSNDSVKAGYGFNGTGHLYEADQFFYHPDHLGSTSYVTDASGEINQHEEYSPFGETFFEEHTSHYTTPYLFNAKEKDAETGLYYYGARYYDAKTSLWMSVDPMAEKYPGVSPYNYCLNNPVIKVDPDGRDVFSAAKEFTIEHIPLARDMNFKQDPASNALGSIASRFANMGVGPGRQNGSIFTPEIRDVRTGSINGMRHALWSTLGHAHHDETGVDFILNLHEDFADKPTLPLQPFDDYLKADGAVDMLNNAIGKEIAGAFKGKNISNVDLAKEVATYAHEKGLFGATKEGNKFVVRQEKISDKQFEQYMNALKNKDENANWIKQQQQEP